MQILVSALDWGLGHTMRIIPIIKEHINRGNNIVFAGSIKQYELLVEFFPNLTFQLAPSPSPVFNKGSNQFFSWFSFLPRFFFSYIKERFLINTLVKTTKFDLIISDNRYGMFHKDVESNLITHQLSIKVPYYVRSFSFLINRINVWAINKFNSCLVPDDKVLKISGSLSNFNPKISAKVDYIGIQTRFKVIDSVSVESVPDILILISGPENQRTVFEEKIIFAVKELPDNISYIIVRGLDNNQPNNLLNAINNCSAGQLKYIIQNVKAIICRSGYSTLMDLYYLNRTALLVPTPGQSEQEYLASHMAKKFNFKACKQSEFSYGRLKNYLLEKKVL